MAENEIPLIVWICNREWPTHRHDCNLFVKAVARYFGITLRGNANQLIDFWSTDPGWYKLGNNDFAATQHSEHGWFVVAGKRETVHGHVVVVVPGRSPYNDAMGYWGSIAPGNERKHEGLGQAWFRTSMKDVQYFATPLRVLGYPGPASSRDRKDLQ